MGAGVVAAAGVALAVAAPDSGGEDRVRPSDTASPARVPAVSVAQCRESLDLGDAALRAARSGVDNWTAHVQARTDLLAGRLTRTETGAIWKRTREAGPQDVATFQAADDAYVAGRSRCTGEAEQTRDAALRSCLVRADAAEAAVGAARTVLSDWAGHQRQMAAHAHGDLDGAHAQDLWVAAWRAAPANIRASHEAERALGEAPRCG